MHLAIASYVGAVFVVAVAVAWSRGRWIVVPASTAVALTAALWLPPAWVFARFVVAMLGFVVAMRALDLLGDDAPLPPLAGRVWLLTAVVDTRTIVRQPDGRSRVPARSLAIAGYATLAAAGWWLAHPPAAWNLGSASSCGLRWLGGAIVVYGLADALCGATVRAHALLGLRLPVQHRTPILATSVRAFWSKHYNLNVSAWLSRHIHRPLARRGAPRGGLVLAFVASAAFHTWLAWVPLDGGMALCMGAFFLVQAIAALLETTAVDLRRLPRPWRHVWTVGWLLLPSPLFVEPFLRILEGPRL